MRILFTLLFPCMFLCTASLAIAETNQILNAEVSMDVAVAANNGQSTYRDATDKFLAIMKACAKKHSGSERDALICIQGGLMSAVADAKKGSDYEDGLNILLQAMNAKLKE